MGSARQLGRARVHGLWRLALGAGALASALASAAPVASGGTPAAAAENSTPGQGFLSFLAQARSRWAGVATLHDFLNGDEGTADAVDLSPLSAPRPRQEMVNSLLSDLDGALQLLQEGGEPETFLASRQADPGTYLTLAQESRARPTLY